MCSEGKWLQNRLPGEKNELTSFLAVDIQGHQRGGFCIKIMVDLVQLVIGSVSKCLTTELSVHHAGLCYYTGLIYRTK